MLAGMQRQRHGVLRREIAPPHAATIHHGVGRDMAPRFPGLPVDAGDAAAGAGDGRHLDVLDDARAAHPRALGQREGDVAGIGLPVGGQVDAGDDAVGVEMRVHRGDLGRPERVHLDVEGPRHGREAEELLVPLGAQGHGHRAALPEAGGEAGLGFQPRVEVGGVFREAGAVLARLQLADEPGGVPGRAGGELLALQQHHVGPAELSQVVGDGTAGDASTNNDDAGMGGQIGHGGGDSRRDGGCPQSRTQRV